MVTVTWFSFKQEAAGPSPSHEGRARVVFISVNTGFVLQINAAKDDRTWSKSSVSSTLGPSFSIAGIVEMDDLMLLMLSLQVQQIIQNKSSQHRDQKDAKLNT